MILLPLVLRLCAAAVALFVVKISGAWSQPQAQSYQGGAIVDRVPGNPLVDQLHVQGRLIGRDLFDRSGHKIGTVQHVLVAPNGMIEGVRVDIGSFLGLGTRTIAVPAIQLRSIDNQLVAADLTREAAESLPAQ
jgi:hypothetical protein